MFFEKDNFTKFELCPICKGKISIRYRNINKVPFIKTDQTFNICECGNCGNAFLNPQPNREIIPLLYSNSYFLNYEKVSLKIDSLEGNSRYLEIGPGNGNHLQKVIDSKKYGEIWVVDVAKSGYSFKDKKSEKMIHYVLGNIDDVDIPKNFFDEIYISHVIEHTSSPLRVIKKMYDGLRLNGKIKLFTPNLNCISNLILKSRANYSCPHHLYFFTEVGLKYILDTLKIKKYNIKKHWGNMLANTVMDNKLVKFGLTPVSIALESLTGSLDTIELVITK